MLGIIGAILGVGKAIVGALAVAGLAIEGLKQIGKLFVGVAQKLGILPKETEVDELGEKALQMDENGQGFDPEKESYDDYMKRLDEFEIDPEKKHDEEEAIKKGTTVTAEAITNKFPDCGDILESVITRHNDLKVDELSEYVKHENASDIAKYLKGTKDIDVMGSAQEAIAGVQKGLGMSDADAYKYAAYLGLNK